MKKNLFIVLAVLLLSCLFVSCSSCPEENVATGSVTFKGTTYYFVVEEETKGALYCSEVFPLYKDEACEEETEYSICIAVEGTKNYAVAIYKGEPEIQNLVSDPESKSFGDNCEVNNDNPEEVYLNVLKPHTVEFTSTARNDLPITKFEVEFYKATSIYVEYGVN